MDLKDAMALSAGKSHFYVQASLDLKRKLQAVVPHDELKSLHERKAWRHFVVLFRQFVLLGISSWVLVTRSEPWIWIPFALVQGFTIFNFTILLHEAIHEMVVKNNRPWTTRALGILYAFPSGISHLQFSRWHLDHHDNLGSKTDDPK